MQRRGPSLSLPLPQRGPSRPSRHNAAMSFPPKLPLPRRSSHRSSRRNVAKHCFTITAAASEKSISALGTQCSEELLHCHCRCLGEVHLGHRDAMQRRAPSLSLPLPRRNPSRPPRRNVTQREHELGTCTWHEIRNSSCVHVCPAKAALRPRPPGPPNGRLRGGPSKKKISPQEDRGAQRQSRNVAPVPTTCEGGAHTPCKKSTRIEESPCRRRRRSPLPPLAARRRCIRSSCCCRSDSVHACPAACCP